jgi:hypothetical protein
MISLAVIFQGLITDGVAVVADNGASVAAG